MFESGHIVGKESCLKMANHWVHLTAVPLALHNASDPCRSVSGIKFVPCGCEDKEAPTQTHICKSRAEKMATKQKNLQSNFLRGGITSICF